jgi:phosphoglycerate dehydrogenase-like enzyme
MVRKLAVNLRAKAPVWRIPESLEREFVAAAPPGWSVEIVQADTVSDGDGGHPPAPGALAAIADAEVYVGYGITRDLFSAAPKLRWVHTTTAGVGSALFPEFVASEVVLTNSAGVHAVPMAEYVVAGLLHFWRGFDLTVAAQRESRWDRADFTRADTLVREAGESKVVVLGTGGIGSAVAIRLSALGVGCVGVRRRIGAPAPDGFARVVGLDALDTVLPEADALVIAVPLTAGTRGAITAARLDLLPSHAVVVNVSRGALLDERALAERLADGRLRGAVLDVFEREPLAPDSPLWQLRRALVTPHISAVTSSLFWDRQGALILDNWRRYVAGEPLRNVVNKDAGY